MAEVLIMQEAAAAAAMDFADSSMAGTSASAARDGLGDRLYSLHVPRRAGARKISSKNKTSAGLDHKESKQCEGSERSASHASTSGEGGKDKWRDQSSLQGAEEDAYMPSFRPRYVEEGHGLHNRVRKGDEQNGNWSQKVRHGVEIGADENEVHAQLSLLALLLAAFRRSGLTCQSPQDEINMDIGWPTNVQHVTHVTFDRFNGFLGLPVEFELEMPRRVPSASASVFGVSAESMQCSYDKHGNSVPTILLLLQERLYDQGALKAEGIFRINPENSQEEHVRDQLNKGNVPSNIDVHCLAGLIKAWLRELPQGVLDSLTPDQILECNTEEDCLVLVKMLPPMQAAILDWTVNLMADVVEQEEVNKMNARNVAMAFAPNMTQMSDPLTALMHAVQVMNFLKTLILRTLQDRRAISKGCKAAPALGLGLPNVSWQERITSKIKLDQKDQAGEKFTHDNGAPSVRNVVERKSSLDRQDKCSVDVEERFFRGFSGRDTADEFINNSRLAMPTMHASVF